MKKLISLSILSCLFLPSLVSAQDSKVTITTAYDDPYKNKWNVGLILAGVDVQNKSAGGVYYMLHGRYTMGKLFTFHANAAFDLTTLTGGEGIIKTTSVYSKLDPFTHIEARASFHFSDKEGSMNNKIKLGQDGSYKYSTSYTTKSRNVYAFTASLNLVNNLGSQMDDSASKYRVMTLTDNNNNDVGFKGNSFINQKNLIIGAGIHIGQYTHFKGKFSASTFKKTRRVKKSIESNFEFLFGLAVNTGDKAYWENPNTKVIEEYKIKDAEKKRLGGRITMDYGANKIGWFQHFEMGYRPGLAAPSTNSKWLNQGYLNWGIGFGF